MRGSMTGRLRGTFTVACGGLLLAALVGCAGSTGMQAGGEESAANKIADVRVAKEGSATVITLVGLTDPAFTAFAQQDPDRVVVDLASVPPDALHEPVAVYDGLVEEVTMSPYSTGTGEATTRVEISLTSPATHAVEPSEEGLVDAIVDAEGYRGADRHGMTPREEREGTPLDERLAAEVPSSPEALGTIGIPDEPGGTPGETDPLQPIPDEPGDPFLHYAMAMEHVSLGDHEAAAATFQDLMTSTPDYVPTYLMLAQTLQKLARDDEAVGVLRAGVGVAEKAGDLHAAGELQGMLAILE